MRAPSSIYKVVCTEFRIVPGSLNCVVNKGDGQLTFRFGTENLEDRLGRPECEFLKCAVTDDPAQQKSFLKEDNRYNIICGVCRRDLSNSIRFDKVLPLPENGDTSDWFCHSHTALEDVSPKPTQVLFSDCFVYLNPSLLDLLDDTSTLYCPHCGSWIGTRAKGSYKVWFNTVSFVNENEHYSSCALNDFVNMAKLLHNSPFSPVRMVLKCVDTKGTVDVILLWVLERNLRVYFDGIKSTVTKVLYRTEKESSNVALEWLSDVNVTLCDVSKPMLTKLSEHLCDMNRYIPKDFNFTNEFNVSYILCNKGENK